jgi:hypothetical protein
LREALAARSDDDFIVDKPTRQARRKKVEARAGVGQVLLSLILRHPGEIFSVILLSGCGGYIAYNALAMQKAHHPAPLFGKIVTTVPAPVPPNRPQPAAGSASAEALTAPDHMASQAQPLVAPPVASPAAPSSVAVTVSSRPAARNPIGDLIRSGGDAAPARPAPVAAIPAPAAAKPLVRDPIADMIRLGGPVPIPPGSVGKVEVDDAVTAAQRALAKLGYGVKVDGVAGPGTRQALESFERDRHLTVTGELGPRTVRELVAQSGIPIQ